MKYFAFKWDAIWWLIAWGFCIIMTTCLSIYQYKVEYKNEYKNFFIFFYMNEDKYLNILNICFSITIFYYILRIICTIIYGFQPT